MDLWQERLRDDDDIEHYYIVYIRSCSVTMWCTQIYYFTVINSQRFYLPTDAQKSCFKRILKFTLKQLLRVSVQSGSIFFELAKVIKIITLIPNSAPHTHTHTRTHARTHTHTHTHTNKDLIKYAATPPNSPQRRIFNGLF